MDAFLLKTLSRSDCPAGRQTRAAMAATTFSTGLINEVRIYTRIINP